MAGARSSAPSAITSLVRSTTPRGILFADVDLDDLTRARYDFDVVGHYNRPDVFHLVVNEASPPGLSVSPAIDAATVEGRL